MNRQKQIAIIGCGYIGLEAAKICHEHGLHVTGTTRTQARLEEIASRAQKSLLIKGNDETEFASLISANETLLIAIGAGSSDSYDLAYRQTAQLFRHLASTMNLPTNLIYLSSTSVYGDHHGRWVDEESELLTETEQGKILIDSERLYQSLTDFGWRVCILRLAEIYGPGRELSKRLKQHHHPFPGTGAEYTNMIHKTDCASAIGYALRHHLSGTYNLADDDHPARSELYSHVATKFHLPKPSWDPKLSHSRNGNKRVSNHKIKSEGFVLHHPHRILD